MKRNKIIRSRAPLRIGLAGGGTDVSPYSDMFGGAILNATVSLFASSTIIPLEGDKIILEAKDLNEYQEFASSSSLVIDGKLDLLKGVYNHITKEYKTGPLSFHLVTQSDVPKGSGMGSSSTITVSIIGAFKEWLNLPLGDYDIAKMAYEIERKELNMAGGKQDQYAATFGGFNFMEFFTDEKVIVNPLRIKKEYINELEFSLLLYYTGTSRLSSKIIESQRSNFRQKSDTSIEAAHHLKEQAVSMKEMLLKGELDKIGEILDFGWQYKKKMAKGITNELINKIYETAKSQGASGGKISGAGGGGFMILHCPGITKYKVRERLEKFGGEFLNFNFYETGLTTWKTKMK